MCLRRNHPLRLRRPVLAWLIAAGAACFSAATGGADAGEVALVPADPWQIIHTARACGPADVGRDAMGDPLITAGVAGPGGPSQRLDYEIAFYGCRLGRNCTGILFVARLANLTWVDKRPAARLFAGWNRSKLIGRAFLDADRRAVLEHPVVMAPGLPAETLRATFELWFDAVREYADHLEIP